MSTPTVNAAAGVIAAAMEQGKQTPLELADALESARLLMSPNIAAKLDRPVDEDPIAYALTDKALESADKLTRLFAPTQALRLETGGAQ